MLKKIMIGLVAAVAAMAVIIQLQPATYKVVRSTTIQAQQAEVFGLINDFHKWESWSPWAKIDPNMKTTYSGAASGVGAVYHWVGNDDVGEGRMTIKESDPAAGKVVIDLEFLKPFESRSLTTFTLQPVPEGVGVNWEMAGDANFMTKAMCLFMSMDAMVGPDFEKGLKQMKAGAERK
jgi:hypothetical protein